MIRIWSADRRGIYVDQVKSVRNYWCDDKTRRMTTGICHTYYLFQQHSFYGGWFVLQRITKRSCCTWRGWGERSSLTEKCPIGFDGRWRWRGQLCGFPPIFVLWTSLFEDAGTKDARRYNQSCRQFTGQKPMFFPQHYWTFKRTCCRALCAAGAIIKRR